MQIVILSHKRADNVLTKRLFKTAMICVPESQEAEYREHNPDHEILVHPDTVVGLSPKRQWAYEKLGDQLQVDDDILYYTRVYQPAKCVTQLTPEETEGLVFDVYENAKEAGAKLWGFNCIANPTAYSGARPIGFNRFITGGCIGIMKDENLYFPDYPYFVGEDCWINLLNAHFNRYSYIDQRFGIAFNKTERGKGGCSDYRREEHRKETYMFLKKSFGEGIKLKTPTTVKKFINKWEKTIQIPY